MGIAAGSLLALLFRLSGMFLWGLIGVLTARTLSVEDRGVYASALIAAAVIGGLSSLGASTGFFVSKRQRDPAEVAANALLVSLPMAVLVAFVTATFGPSISQANPQVIMISALAVAPILLRGTMSGVLIGSNSLIRFNVSAHLPVILAFGFLVVTLVLLDNRTAEAAMIAWCIAQYVSLLPYIYWGRKWWARLVSHRPDPRLIGGMIRFSLVTGVGGIIGLLNFRIDQLLVIRLDSEQGAGIYSSAIAVAEGLWLFSSAIALASYARVGRVEHEEAVRLTATGVRHTMMVVVLGGAMAALLGPLLVEFLFGRPYRDATEPLRILCIGTALFAPQGLVNNYFVNHLGRPSFPLWIGALSLSISFVFGFLLIPSYGTAGAAWATTISYGTSSLVSILLFSRRAKTPLSELWRIRSDDVISYFRLAREILTGRVFATMRARSET